MSFAIRLLPTISIFFIGLGFRYLKLLSDTTGHDLLRLVFYLFLPALVFSSIIKTDLFIEMAYVPLIPIIPILLTYIIITFILKSFPLILDRRDGIYAVRHSNHTDGINAVPTTKAIAGVIYIASMIANTGFMIPFLGAAFGDDGYARAIVYDIGNSFFIFTVIYYVAVKHGDSQTLNKTMIVKKFLFMPPLWAFIAGIIIKLNSMELPSVILNLTDIVSAPTIPVIMLALGLLFAPKMQYLSKALLCISVRMIGGLVIGLCITWLIPMSPLSKIVVIASSAAPCGYNTLIFASMENLDQNIAATIVSLSILVAVIFIPLVILVFGN